MKGAVTTRAGRLEKEWEAGRRGAQKAHTARTAELHSPLAPCRHPPLWHLQLVRSTSDVNISLFSPQIYIIDFRIHRFTGRRRRRRQELERTKQHQRRAAFHQPGIGYILHMTLSKKFWEI